MLLARSPQGCSLDRAERLRTSLLVVLTATHLLCLGHVGVRVAVIRSYHVLDCLISWALATTIHLLVVHIFEPHNLLLLWWRYVRTMLLMIRACCKNQFKLAPNI